MGCNQTTH